MEKHSAFKNCYYLDQEVTFNVSFKQAKNYPVDLYYLMDLTRSMDDDREILASLAQKLG